MKYSRTSILVTPSVSRVSVTKIGAVTKIGVHFYAMNLYKRYMKNDIVTQHTFFNNHFNLKTDFYLTFLVNNCFKSSLRASKFQIPHFSGGFVYFLVQKFNFFLWDFSQGVTKIGVLLLKV